MSLGRKFSTPRSTRRRLFGVETCGGLSTIIPQLNTLFLVDIPVTKIGKPEFVPVGSETFRTSQKGSIHFVRFG